MEGRRFALNQGRSVGNGGRNRNEVEIAGGNPPLLEGGMAAWALADRGFKGREGWEAGLVAVAQKKCTASIEARSKPRRCARVLIGHKLAIPGGDLFG